MTQPIVALIYDFDKTLSPKDMQEYSFLPGIRVEPERFWGLCADFAQDHQMDGVLTYMYLMKKMAQGELDLSREKLRELGRDVAFFPGVETWVRPHQRHRRAERRRRRALHHLLRPDRDHPGLRHRRQVQGGVRRLVLLRRRRTARLALHGGQLYQQDAVSVPHQQGHTRRHQRPRPQRLHAGIHAPHSLHEHDLRRRRPHRRALHEDDQAEGRLFDRRPRAGQGRDGGRHAAAGPRGLLRTRRLLGGQRDRTDRHHADAPHTRHARAVAAPRQQLQRAQRRRGHNLPLNFPMRGGLAEEAPE